MTPDEEAEAERLYRIRKAVRERELRDSADAWRVEKAKKNQQGCGGMLVFFGVISLPIIIIIGIQQRDPGAAVAAFIAGAMLVLGIALLIRSRMN